MAASQPTNQHPADAQTGFRLGYWILFQFTMYGDGDNLTSQEVIIYDSAGTTVIWRSGFRAMDGVESADGWMRVYPEIAVLRSGVTYKWSVTIKDDAPSTSAESAKTSFTMETAGVVQADQRESA
jgi:hypothetical protein